MFNLFWLPSPESPDDVTNAKGENSDMLIGGIVQHSHAIKNTAKTSRVKVTSNYNAYNKYAHAKGKTLHISNPKARMVSIKK